MGNGMRNGKHWEKKGWLIEREVTYREKASNQIKKIENTVYER